MIGFFEIVSRTIFLELTLNCDPPDLCFLNTRITGMSHWCWATFEVLKIKSQHQWLMPEILATWAAGILMRGGVVGITVRDQLGK
jgi:hypothetical protein